MNEESNYDNSVQMAVDIGISKLNPHPNNLFRSGLSSRTDKDVHAKDNYLFTQLVHPDFPQQDYEPKQITETVNEYLEKAKHDIKIKKCIQLPQDFRIYRSAEYREYTYRILFVDNTTRDTNDDESVVLLRFLPPPLNDKVAVICPRKGRQLDLSKIQPALDLFVGKHNFKSFESGTFDQRIGWWATRDPVRDLTHFQVKPLSIETLVKEESLELTQELKALMENQHLIEIKVRADSFLYRQVRMMIGLSLQTAWGETTFSDIQFRLDFPHKWNWQYSDFMAPAHGLSLTKVKLKAIQE